MTTGPIVITGASGFVGQHVIAAAHKKGYAVRAVTRRDRASWTAMSGVETIVADLAAPDGQNALAKALVGARAVIHLASCLGGTDADQRRDTVGGTETLLGALAELPDPPVLVLASSFSVYGYTDLPAGSLVDESTPLEPRPDRRDAYCRGKLAQEALVWDWNGPTWILRSGAIFGPGHLWNAHLGVGIGPGAILFGGGNTVPVSWVGHTAQALLLAADTQPDGQEVINVIDDNLPDQHQYLRAHAWTGWPRWTVTAPIWPLALAGRISTAFPGLGAHLPGLMRREVLAARLKTLRFSNARLRNRLGWQPVHDFETAMQVALDALERISP